MIDVSDSGCALLNLGGTIGEIYAADGGLRRASASALLAAAGLPAHWLGYDIALIDSVEMTFEVIEQVATVTAGDRTSAGFILCCGTDLLEEVGYVASLLLSLDRPIVVTAAALPASEAGSDGPANLRRAAALIASGLVSGVTVVMGDAIFAPAGIVKIDAQALQPFAAGQGLIGRFWADLPCLTPPRPPETRFRGMPASACQARVAILNECMGGTDVFVDPAALDGLVVASAGAGGLARRTRAMLCTQYIPAMPVVLSTRCAFGYVVNPAVPKHALAQARADGLRIDGYAQLSAVQARIRLILEIGLSQREGRHEHRTLS